LIWPKTIAPFDATLLVLGKNQMQEALSIETLLEKECFSILIDDRKDPAGVKFNDAYLIGNPYIMIIGKNYQKSKKIEIENRKTGQRHEITKDKIGNFFRDEYNIK